MNNLGQKFNIANLALDRGDYRTALQAYNAALILAPGNMAIKNNMAVTMIRLSRFREAHELLAQMVCDDPRSALAFYNLGRVCFMMGNYDDSVRNYYRALANDHDPISIYKGLGDSLRMSSHFTAAIECYRKSMELDGTWHDGFLKIGASFVLMGDLTQAIVEFRTFVKKQPRCFDGYESLSYCYLYRGTTTSGLRDVMTGTIILISAGRIAVLDPRYSKGLFKCGSTLLTVARGRILQYITSFFSKA